MSSDDIQMDWELDDHPFYPRKKDKKWRQHSRGLKDLAKRLNEPVEEDTDEDI